MALFKLLATHHEDILQHCGIFTKKISKNLIFVQDGMMDIMTISWYTPLRPLVIEDLFTSGYVVFIDWLPIHFKYQEPVHMFEQ